MLSKFDYYRPDSLQKALEYLRDNPEAKILAGGTDLMIELRRNKVICENILDIKDIPETKDFSYTPGEGLFIGASIIVNEICEDDNIREKYPALSTAADALASYQIRNRATVVGNLCNGSPGADMAAPLLLYDAKVYIASLEGTRTVELKDFFLGVSKTVVKKNEIVIGVSVPDVRPGDHSMYLRKSRIKGHDLCNVGLAMRLTPEKELLLSMVAVATTPLRLLEVEEQLKDKELTPELSEWLAEEVKKHMSPRRGSVRSSPEYRYHIMDTLIKRGLESMLEKGAN